MKIPHAIGNLKNLISPRGGTILITLPLGYNSVLDKLVRNGELRFSKQYYLKRISKGNKWVEGSSEDAQFAKYNTPWPFANVYLLALFQSSRQSKGHRSLIRLFNISLLFDIKTVPKKYPVLI
jgi:hypothetical protein